jgi:hypothetical protein
LSPSDTSEKGLEALIVAAMTRPPAGEPGYGSSPKTKHAPEAYSNRAWAEEQPDQQISLPWQTATLH